MARKCINYADKKSIELINPENKALWKKYLNGKRTLKPSSKDSYTSDMNQFFVFLLKNYDNQCILDIDVEDMADIIEDFLAMCQSVLENKDRRMQRRLCSLSSFFLYYRKKRKITENPVDLIERPKIKQGVYELNRVFLTLEQIADIRKGLEEKNDIQLTLLFELGLYTMARVNAIRSIRLDQIDLENKIITKVVEKEGYVVDLNLNDRCVELIKKWIKEREDKGIKCNYLFITNYNGWNQASTSQFKSKWIKEIGTIIGEPDLSMHDLRHSGSDLRYKAGMPLEEISKALHHSSTEVTRQYYLQEDMSKVAKELEKYDI